MSKGEESAIWDAENKRRIHTCTFHSDLDSSGMASFASWFVSDINCCSASCWLGDSCPVSSAASAIVGTQTMTQNGGARKKKKTKEKKKKTTKEKSRCASAVHAASRSVAENGVLGDASFGDVDKDWNRQRSG